MEELLKKLLKDKHLQTAELEELVLQHMRKVLKEQKCFCNKVVRDESGKSKRVWMIDTYDGPVTLPKAGFCIKHLQDGFPCEECRLRKECTCSYKK
ncbi:MAG: hypothetical protein MJZ34_03105 [Paludibacteraceae bacterium]|nr:hypothetical protein [Paludibacteraceae bacterium]